MQATGEQLPPESVVASLTVPFVGPDDAVDALDEWLRSCQGRSGYSPPWAVARRAASILEENYDELNSIARGRISAHSALAQHSLFSLSAGEP